VRREKIKKPQSVPRNVSFWGPGQPSFPAMPSGESAFKKWEEQNPRIREVQGQSSAKAPRCSRPACKFDAAIRSCGRAAGRFCGAENFLRIRATATTSAMKGRYQHAATKAAEASSFNPPRKSWRFPLARWINFSRRANWPNGSSPLERILRYRQHTLSGAEENLLAMQGQMSEASNQIFRQLNDADLKWGAIRNEKGHRVELGHSSFSAFLHSPSRKVRKEAFRKYYAGYDAAQEFDGRVAQRLSAARRLLRQGAALSQRAGKARSSTIMFRPPSMTISSIPFTGTCRLSIAITTFADGRWS